LKVSGAGELARLEDLKKSSLHDFSSSPLAMISRAPALLHALRFEKGSMALDK
jgi:hypothetical protein